MSLDALNLDGLKKLATSNVSAKKNNKNAVAKLEEMKKQSEEAQRKQLAYAKGFLALDS